MPRAVTPNAASRKRSRSSRPPRKPAARRRTTPAARLRTAARREVEEAEARLQAAEDARHKAAEEAAAAEHARLTAEAAANGTAAPAPRRLRRRAEIVRVQPRATGWPRAGWTAGIRAGRTDGSAGHLARVGDVAVAARWGSAGG